MNANEFYLTETPRPTIEAVLPDGRIITGLRGAPLKDFMEVIQDQATR